MTATKTKRPVSQSLLYGEKFLGCATSPGIALGGSSTVPKHSSRLATIDLEFRNNLRNQALQWEELIALLEASGTGADQSFIPCGIDAERDEFYSDFRENQEHLLDPPEAVATIRAALSLQIKELATVLGVERPTVYAWLRGTAQPQPQNLSRIAELLELAKLWNRICTRPIGAAVRTTFGSNNNSLVALLAEATMDRAKIESLMQELAKHRPSKPKGIHEIAKDRGIDTSSIRESQAEFDVLTGRPFDED